MIQTLTKPTVVVDRQQVLANIESMALKAKNSGCLFRPHFKTHQSATIGEWFRAFDVTAIAVSSLDMAEYFADHHWHDISVCVPVNPLQIDHINRLAQRVTLHLLVESLETLRFLSTHLTHRVKLWIEIDTGHHRSGIGPESIDLIMQLVKEIENAPLMIFQGLKTHAGHAYKARSINEIKQIYSSTLMQLEAVQRQIEDQIDKHCALSTGDTPGCSAIESFSDSIDEIRPGNFVFYDVTQTVIGACDESQIAIALVCPVIASYPERDEIIVYAGAIHLSKESLCLPDGSICYGLVCRAEDKRWGPSIKGAVVSELSQEHGKIRASREFVESVSPGELLAVLPVHSCLTANLARALYTLDGECCDCFRY